ncbi:hypothetical protein [Nocardiopsis sp. NRRL B-16309]|uniref:hypothetical protein n=1 Tax=Nocardiopsis sp. NRRL B-16309 TaxID=1519494 RepID=UPI0006ADDFCB|nr:hypothetical protein [Nocardiopsis sp. NRRL B-16309]KOX16302.1 hypothetical protein ADL05_12495 [Nocardiopsis sp. NRRL B-16309]
MRRVWAAVPVLVLAMGCGSPASEVVEGGPAPTGVAPGVTLYFLDDQGDLRPQLRDTGRLGTIPEAMSLLLAGPGGSDLRTGIESNGPQRMTVTVREDVIELMAPLSADEVSPAGIDQIVCTALAAHVQSGGSPDTGVRVGLTLPTPESDGIRTCPVEH